jgi:sialate O-acetylesterase
MVAVAILVALAWQPSGAVRGDIKPNALFSSGMVLQQGQPCCVWGTGTPGEMVGLKLEAGPLAITISPRAVGQDGRWQFTLPALQAGGPFTLTLTGQNTLTFKEVYIGEVWLASGQSNMEWPVSLSADAQKNTAQSRNPLIRLFTVPKATHDQPQKDLKGGNWVECGPSTVPGFSAVAYFFGREIQKALQVPVGLINDSWGGTRAEAWTSRAVLEAHPDYKGEFQAKPRPGDPNGPSALYNGMIAPVLPFAIKGVIWYQGESNAGQADRYAELFPLMIKNWRHDWKQVDFPFLFVQLAPFMAKVKEPVDTDWARLREAQLLTSLKVPYAAMAVITDVGDEGDIHPPKKEPVGQRLALAALALAYGRKIEYSGPVYQCMTVAGNKAVLQFTHAEGGLVARDGPLTGFTIAGEDRKFHNAQAEIQGDKVSVCCAAVAKPVAVRFGWANYPVVNLWNKAGLPASPFRTDNFPKENPVPPKRK